MKLGDRIGDYRIIRQLGEGGMGQVYLAQHAILATQRVAIKALRGELFANEAARDRFLREAEVLARLNHPGIVRLLNFYSVPEGCFIVMELCEGETLDQILVRNGRRGLDLRRIVPWFLQVLRALPHAHQAGIVHRDIKPANILVTMAGQAKLLDFGTAKLADGRQLTAQGMTIGTINYMSKEQLLGKPLDGRSDLYSVGVTLYEALTGRMPFEDADLRRLSLKIIQGDPMPPNHLNPVLGPAVEAVIKKAMSKSADDRYQTPEEFAQALERLARG